MNPKKELLWSLRVYVRSDLGSSCAPRRCRIWGSEFEGFGCRDLGRASMLRSDEPPLPHEH